MKNLILIFLAIFLCFFLIDCNRGEEVKTQRLEQEITEQNQSVLLENQPPPRLEWSLERENLIKRTNLWNKKDRIGYIYLIDYGKIIANYTVKGKVSSVNSLLTNPERVEWQGYYKSKSSAVTSAPAEDGSYGSNGDAVFFFTTDGSYVEWNGRYILSDKQLNLATRPLLEEE